MPFWSPQVRNLCPGLRPSQKAKQMRPETGHPSSLSWPWLQNSPCFFFGKAPEQWGVRNKAAAQGLLMASDTQFLRASHCPGASWLGQGPWPSPGTSLTGIPTALAALQLLCHQHKVFTTTTKGQGGFCPISLQYCTCGQLAEHKRASLPLLPGPAYPWQQEKEPGSLCILKPAIFLY